MSVTHISHFVTQTIPVCIYPDIAVATQQKFCPRMLILQHYYKVAVKIYKQNPTHQAHFVAINTTISSVKHIFPHKKNFIRKGEIRYCALSLKWK